MNRRTFLRHAATATTALAFSGCTSLRSRGEKLYTNVVIIFADDMGYADPDDYGAAGNRTPNIDQLADQGIRFTSFYVSQAVCSASRASLLTGCYANRIGIAGALRPWDNYGINPEETTIADMLKSQGYATGIFGKWHLGDKRPFMPLQNGFDEYLGLPYSNDMWPVDYDGTPVTEEHPGSNKFKLKYPPLPLIEGNNTIGYIRTLDDQATLTTRYTERAVNFINTHKNEPFFLYVPHSMPHVPLGVSKKFKGKSKQGMYGDVIMEIDWSVGQICKALRNNGIEDNALIMFISDNGPWLSYGNHAGSALPLREGKLTMWEGGVRVPCIMRWPGHIKPGSVCSNMAATIDILPTVAAITKAPLPSRKIDGINILPLMTGAAGANPRNHYFYYHRKELQAVREGKWKLHLPHRAKTYVGFESGKDGWPGKTGKINVGLELYDLEADVSETTDVAAQHPRIIEKLLFLAEDARSDLGDSLTGREGANVRPAGSIPGDPDIDPAKP